MEFIPVIVLVVLAAGLGIWYWRKRSAQADVEDTMKRLQALQQRAKTQFTATPGDPRLKPGWEYITALKKKGEDTFTLTYFTSEGITQTEPGATDADISDMQQQGWHINAQTFTSEGRAWQLERPAPNQKSSA